MKAKNKTHVKQATLLPRQGVCDYLQKSQRPCKFQEIAIALNMTDGLERSALSECIESMQQSGEIIINRRGGHILVGKTQLYQGEVIGHPDGYGFLKIQDSEQDLYLSTKQMRSLLHGDYIVACLAGIDKRDRKQGALVEIIKRANQRVVGRYAIERGIAIVIPNNKRIHQSILLPKSDLDRGIKNGQYVVAEITRQPDKHTQPFGKIVEILGQHGDADMAVQIAMISHEIKDTWPHEVDEEVRLLQDGITQSEIENREDIRHLPLITIDGQNAKDFDDAVYCKPQGDGWILLVAIADVSHYVGVDTALDKEAFNRGNSVYFPRLVVPMLPETLSNGLCSLQAKVDRLCMVCELHIDHSGVVKKSRFFAGIMHSAARMTYDQVASILFDQDATLTKQYRHITPQLQKLHTLFQLLHKHRKAIGAVDFRCIEPYFDFDAQDHVINIHGIERNDAHRLIEEFMLAANVATAELLLSHQIPVPYRVHDKPKQEKLNALNMMLGEMGLQLGAKQPVIKDYANLIEQAKDRENFHLIETLLLRSMQLAVYSDNNIGHFGLAFPAYTHFTSPIRRYADLVVHRAVRHVIGKKKSSDFYYTSEAMTNIASYCSKTDRRAEEASREVIQWYKCDFMHNKVGQHYDGTISGVTAFGVFVELDIYVEGLIHVTTLQRDYYHFDASRHCLQGERTGKMFLLGNRVRVEIMRVNMEDKKIDLRLVG